MLYLRKILKAASAKKIAKRGSVRLLIALSEAGGMY